MLRFALFSAGIHALAFGGLAVTHFSTARSNAPIIVEIDVRHSDVGGLEFKAKAQEGVAAAPGPKLAQAPAQVARPAPAENAPAPSNAEQPSAAAPAPSQGEAATDREVDRPPRDLPSREVQRAESSGGGSARSYSNSAGGGVAARGHAGGFATTSDSSFNYAGGGSDTGSGGSGGTIGSPYGNSAFGGNAALVGLMNAMPSTQGSAPSDAPYAAAPYALAPIAGKDPIQQTQVPDAGAPPLIPDGGTGDGGCTICGGQCVDTQKDLANCGSCGHACKAGEKCTQGACICGSHSQYVVDTLILPHTLEDYPMDLGDGRPHNQFLQFLLALKKEIGLDLGKHLNDLINQGVILFLFDSPPLENQLDPITILQAAFTAKPDFGGRGQYQVDTSIKSTSLYGVRHGLSFDTRPVLPYGPPPPLVTMTVRTPGIPVNIIIPLYCHTIHIDFHEDGTMSGSANGSIRQSDLRTGFAGQLANYFNDLLNTPSYPEEFRRAAKVYDNGGDIRSPPDPNASCQNPDGSKGRAGDNKIDLCELLLSFPEVKVALDDADLQVWQDDGKGHLVFAPNSHPDKKDSISFGLGFSGVGSSFCGSPSGSAAVPAH